MDNLTTNPISALDITHEIKIGDNSHTYYSMAVGPEIATSRRKIRKILKGLINSGDIALLIGPPSSFKTTLAISAVCTAAAGGVAGTGFEYVGSGPMSSAIVVSEDPDGTCDRICGWQQAFNHGKSLEQLAFISAATVKLDTESGKEAVIKMLESTEVAPKLIVFDNLELLMSGDENSCRDIGVLVDNLKEVGARLGATIILIHHTGKTTSGKDSSAMQRMRGSSKLYGCVSDVLELQTLPDRSIKLIAQKVKNGQSGQEYFFKPMQVTLPSSCDTDASNEPDTTVVLAPVAAQEVVQKPSRAVTDLAMLHEAWKSSGGEVDDGGRSILTKSALRAHFSTTGRETTWIENAMKLERSRFLGRLVAAGFVSIDGDTLRITEDGEDALREVLPAAPAAS